MYLFTVKKKHLYLVSFMKILFKFRNFFSVDDSERDTNNQRNKSVILKCIKFLAVYYYVVII